MAQPRFAGVKCGRKGREKNVREISKKLLTNRKVFDNIIKPWPSSSAG